MSILSKVTTGRAPRAQKVVIFAPEGFGKSTLASLFPQPLFLDVEESTSQMDVMRLGREDLPTLNSVEQALAAIAKEKPCQTVVIDTMDWMEAMVLEAMIKEAGSDKIQGIEDFGFGKGYTILREKVTLLLARFDSVIQAGINVVLLAHSKVAKFEPPDGAGPYDRYELKLSKQVAPLIKEWADMLIFGNFRTQVKERDKNDSGQQFKGIGGKERQMHCVRAAAWDAKNRHGMADVEKWDIAVIEKAFRSVGAAWGNDAKTAAAPVPATHASAGPPADKPGNAAPATIAAAPPETATASRSELPTSADPIDGIEQAESEDKELAGIIGPNEAAVNAYLIAQRRIKIDQTYRSLPAEFRARVMKNPAGFLKVAVAQAGKEAA